MVESLTIAIGSGDAHSKVFFTAYQFLIQMGKVSSFSIVSVRFPNVPVRFPNVPFHCPNVPIYFPLVLFQFPSVPNQNARFFKKIAPSVQNLNSFPHNLATIHNTKVTQMWNPDSKQTNKSSNNGPKSQQLSSHLMRTKFASHKMDHWSRTVFI